MAPPAALTQFPPSPLVSEFSELVAWCVTQVTSLPTRVTLFQVVAELLPGAIACYVRVAHVAACDRMRARVIRRGIRRSLFCVLI